jgi:hypothetical protein
MRRLLRDIAEGRDPSVMAALKVKVTGRSDDAG